MDVSESAAAVIADRIRRREEDGHGGLRIRCSEQSESSLGLLIGYVDAPAPGDVVLEAGMARVFVAEDAQEIVDSYTLEARNDGAAPRLYLRR